MNECSKRYDVSFLAWQLNDYTAGAWATDGNEDDEVSLEIEEKKL